MKLFDVLWKWPDGLAWRLTRRTTEASRRKRFDLFMAAMKPNPVDRVLDIGAGEGEGRNVNFFETWYPWRSRITAVALSDLPEFRKAFPEAKLVIGDGKDLPFPDRSFDLVFSNAVVEHVGTERDQKRFVAEACRVGDRVFLSTPNRWFPVDAHTLILFAHWLPLPWRNRIYRLFGRAYFASEERLRLLGARGLRSLVPRTHRARLIRQRAFGWTANFNLVLERVTD
ncbi:class I SAM-dependent methyltransferase [Candidatus Uhrbacteria bacterium]|nr:class I SAM-dependent methyltransferase [Candidatus Uhrbacteria bacterium]